MQCRMGLQWRGDIQGDAAKIGRAAENDACPESAASNEPGNPRTSAGVVLGYLQLDK